MLYLVIVYGKYIKNQGNKKIILVFYTYTISLYRRMGVCQYMS